MWCSLLSPPLLLVVLKTCYRNRPDTWVPVAVQGWCLSGRVRCAKYLVVGNMVGNMVMPLDTVLENADLQRPHNRLSSLPFPSLLPSR